MKLEVHLKRVSENFDKIRNLVENRVKIYPAVKANAYGLGALKIAEHLHNTNNVQGFFVASFDEALELREKLSQPDIFVLNGPNASQDFEKYNLTPVINSPSQFSLLKDNQEFVIHIDTGMNRLGFTNQEFLKLFDEHKHKLLDKTKFIMSHLACAGSPDHSHNKEQLQKISNYSAIMPSIPISFANSEGIQLGKDYHFNMVRPGAALYGIGENFTNVVTLTADIIQIKNIEDDSYVGYDATYPVKKGTKIAILACGYADGYLRSTSSNSFCYIDNYKCKIIGRISMDYIAVDITEIPENILAQISCAELISDKFSVNDLAKSASTIGYEIFTRLGSRIKRVYN